MAGSGGNPSAKLIEVHKDLKTSSIFVLPKVQSAVAVFQPLLIV
jgi:hypothetical protein